MIHKSLAGLGIAVASALILGSGAPAQASQATTAHTFSHVYGAVHNFAMDFEVTNYGTDISLSVESYSDADQMSCTATIIKGSKKVRTLGKLVYDAQKPKQLLRCLNSLGQAPRLGGRDPQTTENGVP